MNKNNKIIKLIPLNRPLIILIGGTSGVGKSAISAEIAYQLKIYRIIGTDLIRDTMRAFFSRELIPDLYQSSFDVKQKNKDVVLQHFKRQTESVMVGVRAAIERILNENLSAIIEGVHLIPGFPTMQPLFEVQGENKPIIIPIVLHTGNIKTHQAHFVERDDQTGHARNSKVYLQHMQEIRWIQDYICEAARTHDVPIVETQDINYAVNAIFDVLLQKI